MKELSIEQKAKAYDEAKLRMSAAYNSNRCTIGFMNEIFPELKESEDERIRKEIISYIKSSGAVTNKKWIAWLEKQGEHANFLNKIQIGDKVTRNEDGVLVNLSQLNRVAKKDEKQGEQKPADEVGNYDHKEVLQTIINEQKPLWSEEDDKMYNSLTEFEKAVKQVMEEAIECGDTHNLKADADMLLRLTQKPWSEEDEDILNTIINHFKVDIECTDEDDTVRWLKSLKERFRKDAFMKKAENFLEMLGYGFTITDNITHANYDKDQLLADFRNYMKE